MDTLVDDVGSFPLPNRVDKEVFDKTYVLSREAIINGKDIREDEFLLNSFYSVTLESFRKKLSSGLDIVNYPQQYDGMKQVSDVVHTAMGSGTFQVEEKQAFLPEVHVISKEARAVGLQEPSEIRYISVFQSLWIGLFIAWLIPVLIDKKMERECQVFSFANTADVGVRKREGAVRIRS